VMRLPHQENVGDMGSIVTSWPREINCLASELSRMHTPQ